jgi:dTMP kinase
VLLDIDPESGLARTSERSGGGDAFEGHWQKGLDFQQAEPKASRRVGGRDMAFHRKVRRGYLALVKQEPQRWLVLDAALPQEMLAEQIWNRVAPSLESPKT